MADIGQLADDILQIQDQLDSLQFLLNTKKSELKRLLQQKGLTTISTELGTAKLATKRGRPKKQEPIVSDEVLELESALASEQLELTQTNAEQIYLLEQKLFFKRRTYQADKSAIEAKIVGLTTNEWTKELSEKLIQAQLALPEQVSTTPEVSLELISADKKRNWMAGLTKQQQNRISKDQSRFQEELGHKIKLKVVKTLAKYVVQDGADFEALWSSLTQSHEYYWRNRT